MTKVTLILTAEETADFESVLLLARATELSGLRDRQRNLSAYSDRQWADRVRSEIVVAERRLAMLNKVIEQLRGAP